MFCVKTLMIYEYDFNTLNNLSISLRKILTIKIKYTSFKNTDKKTININVLKRYLKYRNVLHTHRFNIREGNSRSDSPYSQSMKFTI